MRVFLMGSYNNNNTNAIKLHSDESRGNKTEVGKQQKNCLVTVNSKTLCGLIAVLKKSRAQLFKASFA